MTPPAASRPRSRPWAIAALFALIAGVYAPVLGHAFVPLDDGMHITDNPHVRTGLSAENVRWAFTNTELGYWVPLTWLSHQIDVTLFGLEAGAHHGVSVLLHLVNTALLLLLLRRMTARAGPSLVVAGLFALHPLHVESVAWASERKDVLSTCFVLLAMLAHVRHARRGGTARYLLVLAFSAAALMAKPMAVTLPLLLLLLDAWPLGRLGSASARRRALLEKAPLLLAAAAITWITWQATQSVGALVAGAPGGAAARLQSALGAYATYLVKTLAPGGLAVVYPHPEGGVHGPLLLGLGAALLALTLLLLLAGRRRAYLAVGWLWYVVALLPVVGLVRVGPAWIADRYTYVPLIGVFVLMVFGSADWLRGRRHAAQMGPALACVVLLACAFLAARQVARWKDGATLFLAGIASTPDNTFLLMKHATHLHEDLGRAQEALPFFEQALTLRPDLADIHVNYANALRAVGREDDALAHYEQAVALEPGSALAHYNLAVAQGARGALPHAERHYREALRLDPTHARAHCNLGCILLQMGRPREAVAPLERALELAPTDEVAREALARAVSKR